MDTNNKLTGKLLEFQRDKNNPQTIKLMVRFEEIAGKKLDSTMLIPFRVSELVTDEDLEREFYRGRIVNVTIQAIKMNLKIDERPEIESLDEAWALPLAKHYSWTIRGAIGDTVAAIISGANQEWVKAGPTDSPKDVAQLMYKAWLEWKKATRY